jgi:MFS family permease
VNRQEEHAEGTEGVATPLTITLAVQVLVSVTAVGVAVFMPAVSEEMGFSPNHVGIFVSLIYLGACLASPFSGYLINLFGPILVSQVCLGLCAAGLGVMASASLPLMIAGAVIIGLGYGPVTPASSYLLARTIPLRMISIVFSIKQTGVPLGGALAGALVPYIVVYYGWRMAPVAIAAVMVLSAVLMIPFRGRYDRWRQKNSRFSLNRVTVPFQKIFSHKGLRSVVFASFFFAIMQLCLISFLVTYLTEDLEMSLIQAGWMLSVAQTAGIIGRIVWGAMADRFVKPRIMLGFLGIAMSVMAILAGLFSPAWPPSAVMLVCGIFGAVAIGWNGVYLAEVACLAKPEHAGEVTGGALFFTFCGVLLGLPILSAVFDVTGSYPAGFFLTALLTACWGVLLWFGPKSDPESE